MKIELTPAASKSIADERAFYQKKAAPEISDRFLTAVRQALALIEQHPAIGKKSNIQNSSLGEVRQLALNQYPYAVFYRCEKNRTLILDVIHGARDAERKLMQP
ncbi:type II toxin-antitoxin system RelE/ParE family toxin [Terriglobus saanensis]|uniref:Plasmid stabilization system n=1 Tax=Terriglobus saanensis (strain ATCC BAA-1853 / DSM 23119 / SP1PR4) TaxID=401053 RepID=E8V666_TERSS|nr:type II toxin-antitoxin system RelE/ParE family toxin [Terriglobus saanensis]ADV84957.1 plasmid stabilization system [Terriglobus saanensis SP1PR4]